jgi:hypothetical protein
MSRGARMREEMDTMRSPTGGVGSDVGNLDPQVGVVKT